MTSWCFPTWWLSISISLPLVSSFSLNRSLLISLSRSLDPSMNYYSIDDETTLTWCPWSSPYSLTSSLMLLLRCSLCYTVLTVLPIPIYVPAFNAYPPLVSLPSRCFHLCSIDSPSIYRKFDIPIHPRSIPVNLFLLCVPTFGLHLIDANPSNRC